MKTLDLSSIKIHRELPPEMTIFDVVAIDSEFQGQEKAKLHIPHGNFSSLACTPDGKNVYIIFDSNQIQDFYSRIKDALHIYVNAKYDITQLRRFANIPDRKEILDLQIMEQLLYNGYYSRFSLSAMLRRYCGIYLDKDVRKTFSDETKENVPMTEEQILYAAGDVVATYMVYQEQTKVVDADTQWLWDNIERDILFTLLSQQGVPIDVGLWTKTAQEKDRISTALYDELKEKYGISVRSPKQLLEYLQSQGVKIESTSKKALVEQKNAHPIIQTILDYRVPAKAANTYGMKWLEKYLEEDGKVYTNFSSIGTVTGRFSSSSPNMQQIPVRTDPIYRQCITAGDDDHVLIIADWSSQEPRITAFLSGDVGYMDIFKSGQDIYIAIGKRVFGEVFDKKDKRRKAMKSLVLGLSYGMTKYGLAAKLQQDFDGEHGDDFDYVKYAEQLMKKFFSEFPGVQQYILRMQRQAKKNGYVSSIYGRRCYISPYDSGIDRNAPNYPIQASAADAMKIAAYRMYKRWNKRHGYNPIIMEVHDEIVLRVRKEELEEAATMLKAVMEKTAEEMHPGVTSLAEVGYGKTWAEKK